MKNFRKIPAIDELLLHEKTVWLIGKYKREFVVDMLRRATDELRRDLSASPKECTKEELMELIVNKMEKNVARLLQGTLQKVINGTGVVLHTNLGRAPLSEGAINYLQAMAVNYNNLELDLEQGLRGSRYWHIEDILTRLTGAEAALVVNNNAAAVLLGLNTLAKGREVIVSRGQLVEIGGAFRIPEVMKLSGAQLVEVGTTNRTYISDFAAAITEETALLFAAHTSNYKIVGFSEEVPMEALVKLGRERGMPVMQDLGSGILCPDADWGLREEPSVNDCVKAGADIITFSGDKLLGGPQAGIVLGKKSYIEAMKKNQLTRALRVDKLTIAALEGTLLEYLSGHPQQNIPVIRMLGSSQDELQQRAEKLAALLQAAAKSSGSIRKILVLEVEDMVGGGAYPTHKIPGWGVEIEFTELHLSEVAKKLRAMNPALLTRKQDDKMLISVRTLLPGDEEIIVEMLAAVQKPGGSID
ncbi:MAG: L-seryl-tRNA(Sec) selenium transferase [Syntrophomonadaceae bacterium]|nr:L-seryl-tRNA(Sec) selenium transferase [Syntrophomonadaceae bacterium]